MLKVFTRFLLSLCFLLLGAYAHTSQMRMGFYPKNIFNKSTQVCHAAIESQQAFYRTAHSSGKRNVNDPLKATEVKDDEELKPSKKSFCTSCIAFLTPASSAIYYSLIDPLPFCEHFSYTSAFKFIIHCVIRV